MNPRILKELGIDWPWLATPVVSERAPAEPVQKASVVVAAKVNLDQRADEIAKLSWASLTPAIEACRACGLGATRKHVVPGVGDLKPQWLFVGEGPGTEEDQQGEPFVGVAGQLLDRMLEALDLKRSEVYLTNVVKCRPPGNRTPSPEECGACGPFLKTQIQHLAPRVIVALGRVAAQALLETDYNLGSLRGQAHQYQGIPVVVTYHPAYLLRNLPEKARAWQDLCFARSLLEA